MLKGSLIVPPSACPDCDHVEMLASRVSTCRQCLVQFKMLVTRISTRKGRQHDALVKFSLVLTDRLQRSRVAVRRVLRQPWSCDQSNPEHEVQCGGKTASGLDEGLGRRTSMDIRVCTTDLEHSR